MRKYTDISVKLQVDGLNLFDVNHIHVTFKSGRSVIDVTNITVTGQNELLATLTQEQTGQFESGQGVDVQLNYFDESGFRNASDIAHIPVESNLLRRILHE